MPWRRRQDRHRRPDAETPWPLAIAEADARASRPRTDGSTRAPNPGTSCEASSEMKENKRTGGLAGRRPNARRGSARVRRRERGRLGGSSPGRGLPEHARAASKGGEHRHELNTLRKRQVAAARLRASSRPSRGAGWFPRQRRVGGARGQGVKPKSRRSRGCLAEGDAPKEGGGLCPEYGSSRTKGSRGLAR